MKFKTELSRHVNLPSSRYALQPEITCRSVSGQQQEEQSGATSYPGSLPTPGAAGKTLVAAGHVNPQILGVNRISAFLLLREEW